MGRVLVACGPYLGKRKEQLPTMNDLHERKTNDGSDTSEEALNAEILTLFRALSLQDKLKALAYLRAFSHRPEGPSSGE